jgi:DNA-binding NarL/FixJ family response regulator
VNLNEEKIRVLVVGDSPLVRAGLEAAISQAEGWEVAGACNLANAAALMASTGAAAVLMEGRTFSSWSPDKPAKLAPVALTPREIEVLRLLADGASNKIIAHKLGISDHTAKFHVTSILTKLNAGTRTEAVTLGMRMGLVAM